MTVSVESCFLVRSACHAIFCDTQGGFRWQPKQRTVARVPRYIQSLSKPTELFAAAPICLFIARLNFKCLLLSGCRGLSTLPRLSQVLSTLPWSSLGVPLALPWRSLDVTSSPWTSRRPLGRHVGPPGRRGSPWTSRRSPRTPRVPFDVTSVPPDAAGARTAWRGHQMSLGATTCLKEPPRS